MSNEDEFSLAASLLISARQQAGLTQAEFAERVGVPRSMVSAYERGLRQATLPTLQRLLRAAGYELRLEVVATDSPASGPEGQAAADLDSASATAPPRTVRRPERQHTAQPPSTEQGRAER